MTTRLSSPSSGGRVVLSLEGDRVKVIYKCGGDGRVAFAEVSDSVMRTAVNADIPGIEGECGGEMTCGTCHVYVDPAWLPRIKPPSDDEADNLDLLVDDIRPESRLSCQLVMTPDLDGLVVEVAVE